MVAVAAPATQRVVVRDVSWTLYEQLVAEIQNHSSPRLTYDQGCLEFMSPGLNHERANRTLAFLVRFVATELGVVIQDVGSTTCKYEHVRRGFEADSGFYIDPSEIAQPGHEIDLEIAPPPDLVIEIDMSRSSLPKLALYADLNVSEVWVWDNRQAQFYVLANGQYSSVDRSQLIPVFTPEIVTDFLATSLSDDSVAWYRAVKEWVDSL